MKLLLDIGNSRIKWAWLQDAAVGEVQADIYDRHEISAWCSRCLAASPRPDSVWIANVAGTDVAGQLRRWCRDQWRMVPVFAQTEQRDAGVVNGYDDVREMGVDRWLAMVAARQRYARALCIISCGTAVTVDALTASGAHKGGLILPGPALMQEALKQATQGVHPDGDGSLRLELGRSTRTGVSAGSTYAIVSLIERVFAEQQQADPDVHGIITGGAAAAIMSLCRVPLECIPHLVLQGLAHYALRQS